MASSERSPPARFFCGQVYGHGWGLGGWGFHGEGVGFDQEPEGFGVGFDHVVGVGGLDQLG